MRLYVPTTTAPVSPIPSRTPPRRSWSCAVSTKLRRAGTAAFRRSTLGNWRWTVTQSPCCERRDWASTARPSLSSRPASEFALTALGTRSRVTSAADRSMRSLTRENIAGRTTMRPTSAASAAVALKTSFNRRVIGDRSGLRVGKNLVHRSKDRLLCRERRLGVERIGTRRPCEGGLERRLSLERAAGSMEKVAEQEVKPTAFSLETKDERAGPAIRTNSLERPAQRRRGERTGFR